MNDLYYLGADPTPSFDPAMGEYLTALRGQAKASWSRAEAAYLTLKKVREQLGLPFIDDGSAGTPEGGSAANHGAWTSDLDANAQDLHAMSVVIDNALADAVAGKRQVSYDDKGNTVIAALPSDVVVIAQDSQGVPYLMQGPAAANPGQPAGHAQAPIGVGVPGIVWAGVATVGFSVLALPAYFIWDAATNGLVDVAQQKTMKTMTEEGYKCINSGKCTPEQVANINKSISDGAADVNQSRANVEAAKNKPTEDFMKAITTLGYIALGVGILYVIVRYLPAPSAGGAKLLPAHASNPKYTEVDRMDPPDKNGRHPRYKHLVMFEIEPHYGSYILTAAGHRGDALISSDDAVHMFGKDFDDGFGYLTDEYLQLLEKAA